MVDLLNMKDDVINFLFYMNIIALIIGIFVSSKVYFISVIVLNLIFSGTLKVIAKYSHIFDPKNKLFGSMGNLLDMATSMGSR